MAIDYVSTAPWNNPYNPWPVYNVVRVSYTGPLNTINTTLTASEFLPAYVNPGVGGPKFVYANNDASVKLQWTTSNGGTWSIRDDTVFFYAGKITTKYAVPFVNVGQGYAAGWQSFAYSSNVNSLYIGLSGITGLNLLGWEMRRIAGGAL